MFGETSSCPHIQAELSENFGEAIYPRFKQVVTWNVHRSSAVRAPKRRRISPPTCGICDLALSRPFACLHCDAAFCWEHGHAITHSKQTNHTFCVDAKSGRLYCSQCDDFIYDSTLDELYTRTVVSAEEKETRFQESKNLRETFKPWSPTDKDTSALENAKLLPCQSRRGLVNLGQTCFLNVVLQCLVHNPLLRSYFLGDRHNWRNCKLDTCTCCEMDKLFTEVYSDDPAPYGPTSFLYTLWKVASSELSGYAQQDAHEFFIATLNQIHSTCRGSTNVSCNCVIHNTFAGQLQSDVKCERCGNTTTTIDPTLDISLELKGTPPENTLAACLRRYTQPERLGPKEYSCSKCAKGSPEASKRLSIRKLPSVLSIQFKRFEQRTNDKSRKIDTQVQFPSSINMAPYTTLVMKEMEKENANGPGAGVPFSYPGPEALYEYDLFAVINHEGQIDNGHYINYARFQDEWYRFDDDKVTHTTLASALASNAYMCFYVKRHLDYKPYQTPTYVLMREKEEQKERERELKEREREAKGGGSVASPRIVGGPTARILTKHQSCSLRSDEPLSLLLVLVIPVCCYLSQPRCLISGLLPFIQALFTLGLGLGGADNRTQLDAGSPEASVDVIDRGNAICNLPWGKFRVELGRDGHQEERSES